MNINLLSVVSIALVSGFLSVISAQTELSKNVGQAEAHFPKVSGKNLVGKKYNLPNDLEGELSIVFVAFERDQQTAIDTWIPDTKKLVAKYPNLRYYEIPTIKKLPGIVQSFINSGMRRGIPDKDARAATITLYLDKTNFLKEIGIADEKKIYVYLVNRTGKIFWKAEDRLSIEKFAELEKKVTENLPPATPK